MQRILYPTLTLAAALAATNHDLRAQYAEGFDSGAADVQISADPDTLVQFVDYSNFVVGTTRFNIPEAPRRIGQSAPTRGILLGANLSAGAGAAVNVLAGATPYTFAGNYTLQYDVFMSLSDVPFPTSGSTEQLLWGVGTDGAAPNEARINRGSGAVGTWGWLANENGYGTEDAAINENDIELADLGDTQPGESAPFNAAFSDPIPIGAPNNAPANEWVQVDVIVNNGNVRVLFNGVEFFSVASATTVGSAMLGYEDPFSSVMGYTPPAGSPGFPVEDVGWALFDNFRVVAECGFPVATEVTGLGNEHSSWGNAFLSTTSPPVFGGTAGLRLDYASPTPEPAVLFVSLGAAVDPLAALPPLPLYVDLASMPAAIPFMTAGGSTELSFNVRNDTALCSGTPMFLQAVIRDMDPISGVAGPFPLVTTNRVDWTIGDASSLVITEIMQNPAAVLDSNGEWFEIHNPTGVPVDLDGWTIADDGSDSHVIVGPLVIAPGGYLVLGINADSATNGGVTVDYQYSTFFLANGDDEVILIHPTAGVVDRVTYDDGFVSDVKNLFPDPNGASMSLNPALLNSGANDFGLNWCPSTTVFGAGDLGTPGAANDSCP